MADERGKHHSGQHLKIRHLAREYPTATSAEIALAVYDAPARVRSVLGRVTMEDEAEISYRSSRGLPASPDDRFVRIMRKRVEVNNG